MAKKKGKKMKMKGKKSSMKKMPKGKVCEFC